MSGDGVGPRFGAPAFFGDRYAHEYDERHVLDPAPAVEFLAGLVPEVSRVLELAVGTGRVAVPLAARGVAVEGVDGSAAMIERMREKPGGAAIPAAVGDMADVAASVSGPFKLAYLVFNKLFNLPGQERRIDCFRNVAAVLEPGGLFVTECFAQDLTEFDRGQRLTFDAQGTTLRPLWLSYCWPSELDLMARLASTVYASGMRIGTTARSPGQAAATCPCSNGPSDRVFAAFRTPATPGTH